MPKHNCGVSPLEYKVIVLPDAVETTTAGGIILTDAAISDKQTAATRGEVVAISPIAFNYDEFPPDSVPVVGSRVLMGRYTGVTFTGADGQDYRIMNDKDIIGLEQ